MVMRNQQDSETGLYQRYRKSATALGYDPEKENAPRVLASGRGFVAEQIIATARANGIPIREDPLLAEVLSRVNIDQEIPPELYALVAEVLAYIYRLQGKSTV